VVALAESLLAEQVTNGSSVRLMEHADHSRLEDFEDADFQDQLERSAAPRTSGRLTLMGQIFGRCREASRRQLIVGLAVYAPLLILLLALAWSRLLEASPLQRANLHARFRPARPNGRELDYVRQTAASVETAKEVKIFGLHGFLVDTTSGSPASSRREPHPLHKARRMGQRVHHRRTIGYYTAYAYIVWRTLHGDFTSAI